MADNKGRKNPFLDEEPQRIRGKSTDDESRGGRKVSPDEALGKDVFKKYTPLPEIAGKIAEELNGIDVYKTPKNANVPCKEIMDSGLTFFMSKDAGLKRTGLLSLFPALSTGIRLYKEMSESKTKEELLKKIKSGVEVVFKIIYMDRDETDEKDEDWRVREDRIPVFDASPYESDAFYAGNNFWDMSGRSYIDSISWAVDLFFKIMNMKGPDFEDYRKEAKELIKWCLSYVNNAVLTFDTTDATDNNEPYKRPVGWNFSKINTSSRDKDVQRAQSSLYFTYAAASIYLSFYEEYKDVIDDLQTLNRALDKMESMEGDEGEKNKKIIQNLREHGNGTILLETNDKDALKAIEDYANTLDDKDKADELLDALEAFKKCDRPKLNEYYDFNEKKSAEYNGKIYKVKDLGTLGPITLLKWNLEKISADIWEEARDVLENNFVYDGFGFNVATSEAIKSGVQTNALFAGLLHISICLYSKYDFVVYYTEDDGSEKFGKKAYDDMQNTMLLHVQRAQREFDKLTKEGKAFGVDFLILRFSEKFSNMENMEGKPTDSETAERLRKQLIRITSLTPMLLKTNNLISQYVVKYPQKQMGEAIAKIGEKRFYDRVKKTYRWFWESDGYHAMSNYYYVGAIFDFYAYYRDYEEKYTKKLDDLKGRLIKDIKYTESVQAYYQEIEGEKEKLEADYKEKIEELEKSHKEELKNKDAEVKTSEIGRDLVSNIIRVVMEKVADDPEFLKKIINELRKQLAKEVSERYSEDIQEDKEISEELKKTIEPKDNSFFSLLQALAADIILQSAIEGRTDGSGRIQELGKGFANDFKPAYVVLNGGEQLIKKDKKINELFAQTFDSVNFKKCEKWKKTQKTKEEK